MERRALKIKLNASGVKSYTSSGPDRGGAFLLEGAAAIDLTLSSEDNILIESSAGMKRKRGPKAGHKKGKKNVPSVVNDPALVPVCINTEDSICLDENDDGQMNRQKDMELPSLGSDKLSTMSNIDADLPNDRPIGKTGPGRVKVKLRSSRVLEHHRSYSDAQTPSDTARSNQQIALEMNDTALEKEDSTYSDGQTSEMQNIVLEKVPRKAASIKIKSSRGLGLSTDIMQDKNLNKLNSPPQMLSDKSLILSDNERTADSSAPKNLHQRETKLPYRDPCQKGKELSKALAVIKKVMKMDAAGPFNAPVNPVALGIPDYFDIIDSPMDFGTICHNLEHGSKYVNSEDVYKDVQIIWENCYKYNNKGDYIVDLMKRVKKNFMKYWIASGLYSDISGYTESNQIGDATRDGLDKLYPKRKSKHKRRRYGIDCHKSDCLCAVCVVRRRRKEHDESQVALSDANHPREFKLEESSPMDNLCSEDAASSLDHSPETDANVDVEEVEIEEKLDTPDQTDSVQPEKRETLDNDAELHHNASSNSEPSQQLPIEIGAGGESSRRQQPQEQQMDLEFVTQPSVEKDDRTVQEETALAHHHHAEEEERRAGSGEMGQQIKMREAPVLQENHSILEICRSLFTNDRGSVWNGRHSLIPRHASVPVRRSPIHVALATFMKR